MGMGCLGASRTWAVLLGTGLLLGGAAPGLGQVQLAQVEASLEVEAIEPFTIEGTLDESNFLEEQGIYGNGHPFEGQAGQQIRIEISSDNVFPILVLVRPNGEVYPC